MDKVEVVKRAIEMTGPAYIPLEVVECPGIYDAYGNLDPWQVEFLPGTENFDSIQATYHWTLAEEGTNEKGERLRRDEWGCAQRVPADDRLAYVVTEEPMKEAIDLDNYTWPDISITDPFFERISKAREAFPDRFLCGYIDPGPFLIAFNLMSYEGLLMNLVYDIEGVKAVFEGIVQFQVELVKRWKQAGAHMVNYIDEFAGNQRLMLQPAVWREHFKPFFQRLIQAVKDEGMYCGFCLDGDVREVLPDFVEMGLDVLDARQINCMGMDAVADVCKDICVKTSIDMLTTLATGTPDEVRREARALVEQFGQRNGGYIAMTLKWHRPEYLPENVAASVEAFNEFRTCP